MLSIKDAASEFLALKRIAVTGVSRKPRDHGSNTVFKRLRDCGYQVFAVNPNADRVEGARSYHDLRSIPGGVEAVVIATAPDKAEGTMRECAELGIKHVWMHRGYGQGSVNPEATAYGRHHGITVIDAAARSCSILLPTSATSFCGWSVRATSRRRFKRELVKEELWRIWNCTLT
jgi:predicted CoA-binding protein